MAELLGLFTASFVAATIFPLPSEAALFAYLRLHPGNGVLAVAVATLGNTLGGMTTYFIGHLFPASKQIDPRALHWLRRLGPAITFFAWVPIVGDALGFAAGWLRLRWWTVLLFMAAGRLLRYIAIAAISISA